MADPTIQAIIDAIKAETGVTVSESRVSAAIAGGATPAQIVQMAAWAKSELKNVPAAIDTLAKPTTTPTPTVVTTPEQSGGGGGGLNLLGAVKGFFSGLNTVTDAVGESLATFLTGTTDPAKRPWLGGVGALVGSTAPASGSGGSGGATASGSIEQKTALYNAAVAVGERIIGEGYGEQYARLLQHESANFDPAVLDGSRKSSAGAIGIAQFMPATAAGLGVDPLDLQQAMDGGAYYLKQQLNNFGGDMRKALAAYNAGPGKVQSLVAAYGDNWENGLVQETKDYLRILAPPLPGELPVDPSITESGRQFDALQALRLRQFQEDVRQFGADEAYRRDALRQGGEQTAASLAEARRQFNTTFGLNEAALTGTYGGSPTENARQFDALFGENARQFDASHAQSDRQFDARLGFDVSNTDANRAESARQANLGAIVDSNGQQMAALPQFGQLALQGNEQVRDILSNGKDALYRAYRQRGESSPAGLVTQADQINQLLRGFDTIAARVPEAINPQNPLGTPTPAPEVAPAVVPTPTPTPDPTPTPNAGFVIGTQPAMAAVQGQSGLTPAEAATKLQEAYSAQGYSRPAPAAPAWAARAPAFVQRVVGRAGGGPVSMDGVAVVGENGPEVVRDTPQGFEVINEQQLGFDPLDLLKHGVRGMSTGGIDWSALLRGGNQQVTQQQLNDYGAAFLPPAARDTLAGNAPAPIQSPDFKAFTPQQIMALDNTEKGALDTYLQNKYQTSLGDAEFQTKQLFGPANRRDAPRVRGFSL